MQWLRAAVLALLSAAAALPGAALAHLMPAGQGALRIEADAAFLVVSLPVSAFTGFDSDGDGLMSLTELNLHRDALLRQAAQRLDLRAGGEAGQRVFEDLLIPHLHEAGARPVTGQLIVMQRYRWPAAPGPLGPLTLRADIFDGSAAPVALQASDGKRQELVLLTPHYREHHFFEGNLAALGRFMLTGAQHILLGLDHLLFLLTVLVAGAGWRYWATVVTSFTLAHSVTLTLASLGWVAVPPSIAEPLIAASIVLMALDNLRRRRAALGQRAALVFACGLVHGLGFASALRELGGAGDRWLGLLGFNLGVEAGQLLFVTAALALMAGLSRVWPAAGGQRMVQAASLAAMGLGSVLLLGLLAG